MFVTVDKHQRFESFISQTTSVRLEHSSSDAETSFVSIGLQYCNFKIAVYFFKLPVRILSAVRWPLDCLQGQHILCSFSFEVK